jgi:hypothetical protein
MSLDERTSFMRKSMAQSSVKDIVRSTAAGSMSPTETAPRAANTSTGDRPGARATTLTNPTVVPGKVAWHADFDAACLRARTSGRPVLLFQMLGRLDQQFC